MTSLKTSLLILLAANLSAQVKVEYSPILIGDSQAIFGPGRTVGLWRVSFDNTGLTRERLSWERIVSASPKPVPWYTNEIAADLVTRQTASAPKTRINKIIDSAPVAGAITAATGFFLHSQPTQYVGMGIPVAKVIIDVFRGGAPDPSPYLKKMLPDEIALEPGQGATYYIGSGKVHKVEVMRGIIGSRQVSVLEANPSSRSPEMENETDPARRSAWGKEMPAPRESPLSSPTYASRPDSTAQPVIFDRTAYEYSGDTPTLRAWRLKRIMQARRVMAGL